MVIDGLITLPLFGKFIFETQSDRWCKIIAKLNFSHYRFEIESLKMASPEGEDVRGQTYYAIKVDYFESCG